MILSYRPWAIWWHTQTAVMNIPYESLDFTGSSMSKTVCLRIAYFLTCWIVLNIIEEVFAFRTISRILLNRRRPNLQWSNPFILPILYWQYRACWFSVDLRSQSIIRSGMVMIPESRNIPSPAPKESEQYLPLMNKQIQANNQPWCIRRIPLCLE